MSSRGPASPEELQADTAERRAQCEKPLVGARVEEVAYGDYYRSRGEVPPVGTGVRVRPGLGDHGLEVETEEGELLGRLDPSLSYLLGCLTLGYGYTGRVVASVSGAEPVVLVDLVPSS